MENVINKETIIDNRFAVAATVTADTSNKRTDNLRKENSEENRIKIGIYRSIHLRVPLLAIFVCVCVWGQNLSP